MAFRQVASIIVRVVLVAAVLAFALPFAARGLTAAWAARHISPADDAPPRQAALVLGARVHRSGRLSAMLADRVAAAVDLYHSGRVDALLMSGDNSRPDYNEPDAMRDYAISLGVPESAIFLDYGGRRTYDSCYRARHIFQTDGLVVVTQQFHLPRALMLCRGLGIDAVGVAADYKRPTGYSERSLQYSRTREIPATALAVIDLLRREEPPVMGDPLPLLPTAVE